MLAINKEYKRTNCPPYYIDTETVGLHGVVSLIQYALGDGEIVLFSPWESAVSESIELIEQFANNPGGCIFFNAAFDWFQLYKWWTICKLMADIDPTYYPEDHIDLVVELEEKARDYPQCLKPVKVLDLFLHARKGPYQSTMDRKDIKIRKVPSQLAWMVAEELERRVPFKEIYFARRKDKSQSKWQIFDRKDSFGDIDPNWKDIVVRFKPSSALKALAADIGLARENDILKFGDISPKLYPVEFGYVPFAKGAMKIKYYDKGKEKRRRGKYRNTWPDYIKQHIIHWGHHEMARKYAQDDIVYTRGLDQFFGYPEMSDDDSELAVSVACSRWRGFKIDLDGIRQLRQRAVEKKYLKINNPRMPEGFEKVPVPTSPGMVKNYIMEVCDPQEKLGIQQDDTRKVTLEYLAKTWTIGCMECFNKETGQHEGIWCPNCKGERTLKHPAAKRAQEILDARKANKEIELYDKLLVAGRLHASFKVIGTLSSRMSGADGLNAQAIKKTREVKSRFLLAQDGYILAGGDFEGFEVTIAEAVYNDPDLRRDLLTCEKCSGQMIFNQERVDYLCEKCGSNKGKKIHALFGVFVYPDMNYEQIKATDGSEDDKYTKCKQAVFAMMYGGEGPTLEERLGVPLAIAEEAHRKFTRRYKGVGRAQERVTNMFASMRQPNGKGTKVEWHEPSDKFGTLFGFYRYFTLENQICKALYDLATNMPPAMQKIKLKVMRTDREQLVPGAARSAIYAAAFNIQSFNKRAATNHEIQGTGAQATKRVQRAIWDLQPSGVHKWIVQPLNIHDSVMTPVLPEYVKKVEKAVYDSVESIRPTVPLIKMPWESYLADWSDKCGPICAFNPVTNEIVAAYKDRRSVTKFGYDFNEVYRCLTKRIPTYRDLGWRVLIKDENRDEIKECLDKGLFAKAKAG